MFLDVGTDVEGVRLGIGSYLENWGVGDAQFVHVEKLADVFTDFSRDFLCVSAFYYRLIFLLIKLFFINIIYIKNII